MKHPPANLLIAGPLCVILAKCWCSRDASSHLLAPNINASAARVLDRLGISLIKAPDAGCCGALSYHLNAQQEGLDYMRRNVDAWWPYIGTSGGAGDT